MKKIYYLVVPVFLLLVTGGCKKSFSDLYQNPNKPASVPPSILFNGVLTNLVEIPSSASGPTNSNEIWDQYYIYNYDYYGNNRYEFGAATSYYGTLENVVRMEQEAVKLGVSPNNPYSALGKFFRAFFFIKMSMQLGDIPMTQALAGIANLTPAYDPQKKVFQQCLAWLDSANTQLAGLITSKDNSLSGDIFYKNDLKKWQKAVNSYTVRVLLHLSKKTADADLNVAQHFAAILGDPAKYPLMENASDNLEYVFVTPSNFYPDNANNFGQTGSRKNMSATHVGLLTQLNDPRVFVVAEPCRYQVDTLHKSPTDVTSFVGADPALDLGIMYNNAGLQRYSFLNRKRYFSGYTAENAIQVGYAEQCFNIAEGINRGWYSTGNAEDYYKAGIRASLDFYGIPSAGGAFTAYFYRPGSTDVTSNLNYDTHSIPFDWNTFYNQAGVKYDGNTATGLTQILQQKYLALFRQSDLEAYYTYRLTGVPAFSTGPGTGNSNRIAMRFKYPGTESAANTKNYQAALQSQYSGNDDINAIMWLLK